MDSWCYAVNYRRNVPLLYLPDGDNVELDMPHSVGSVIAAAFDRAGVEALVRGAQMSVFVEHSAPDTVQ